jgi:hypothetical protein
VTLYYVTFCWSKFSILDLFSGINRERHMEETSPGPITNVAFRIESRTPPSNRKRPNEFKESDLFIPKPKQAKTRGGFRATGIIVDDANDTESEYKSAELSMHSIISKSEFHLRDALVIAKAANITSPSAKKASGATEVFLEAMCTPKSSNAVEDPQRKVKEQNEVKRLLAYKKKFRESSNKPKRYWISENSLAPSAYGGLVKQRQQRWRADESQEDSQSPPSPPLPPMPSEFEPSFNITERPESNDAKRTRSKTDGNKEDGLIETVLLKFVFGKSNVDGALCCRCCECGRSNTHVQYGTLGRRTSLLNDTERLFLLGGLSKRRLDRFLDNALVACEKLQKVLGKPLVDVVGATVNSDLSNGAAFLFVDRASVAVATRTINMKNATEFFSNVLAFYFLNPFRISLEGGKLHLYQHVLPELLRRDWLSRCENNGPNNDRSRHSYGCRECDIEKISNRCNRKASDLGFGQNLEQDWQALSLRLQRTLESKPNDLGSLLQRYGSFKSKQREARNTVGTKERWSEIEEFLSVCSQRNLKEEIDICEHLATMMRLHKLTHFDLNSLIVDRDSISNEKPSGDSWDARDLENSYSNRKFFCPGCRKVSAELDVSECLKVANNGAVSEHFSDSIIRRFVYGGGNGGPIADSKKYKKREIMRVSKESSVSIQMSYSDKLTMLEKISMMMLDKTLESFDSNETPDDGRSVEANGIRTLENCVRIGMCLSTAFFEIAATFANQLSRVEFDMLCSLGSVPFYSASCFEGCSYAERLKNKVSELKSDYRTTMENNTYSNFFQDNRGAGYPEAEYQACKSSRIEGLDPNYYLSNRDENSKIFSIFLQEG